MLVVVLIYIFEFLELIFLVDGICLHGYILQVELYYM